MAWWNKTVKAIKNVATNVGSSLENAVSNVSSLMPFVGGLSSSSESEYSSSNGETSKALYDTQLQQAESSSDNSNEGQTQEQTKDNANESNTPDRFSKINNGRIFSGTVYGLY